MRLGVEGRKEHTRLLKPASCARLCRPRSRDTSPHVAHKTFLFPVGNVHQGNHTKSIRGGLSRWNSFPVPFSQEGGSQTTPSGRPHVNAYKLIQSTDDYSSKGWPSLSELCLFTQHNGSHKCPGESPVNIPTTYFGADAVCGNGYGTTRKCR